MKTILIIEDDVDTAGILANFLDRKGFKAVSVEDGLEGLTLIKFLKPDVVIVDLMLPGMDGRQLIHRIRENIYTRHKMVMVISGTFTRTYAGGKVKDIDADSVFSKPLALKKIHRSILRFFSKPKGKKSR